MITKDRLLEELSKTDADFVPTGLIDSDDRNVESAITELRRDGYIIDSEKDKGIRFSEENRKISAAGIRRFLKSPVAEITVTDKVVSTNDEIKAKAESGAPEGTLFYSEEQTGGRGRNNKSFFSPEGSGIYFSLLLRPVFEASITMMVTSCAAVAVCRSIEELFPVDAKIKWVNDIYVSGKKVCGILAEGAFEPGTRNLSYVVLGIGVNLFYPEGGFGILSDVAGAICDNKTHAWKTKCKLIAAITDSFFNLYNSLPSAQFIKEYKNRSFLTGKKVKIINGPCEKRAEVIGITDDLRLSVRYDNGFCENIESGEVSISI